MNEQAVKTIYATLQVMKVPFKMYKTNKNTTTVFAYKDNVITVTDTEVTINNDVVKQSELIATVKAL